ncbi:MAG: LacI family DNA-binding transcriptional regulator [Bryobacteraceae bacterium]|nr:LacI family transcriptional regulator [Bryobacterales bacterium]MEB2363243.1 LacI family DNA-binding transcriptional regulator [Bryobacterales bacterium]NUN02950.1 LacI family DNA-binding transcriptional regulator [Bryobacteraceae bacterium]
MPSTIKDVARAASVSIGTVSRVINNYPDVDPELRERVQEAIRSLNYRPNARARTFVQNATPVLSFVLSNRSLLNPFHSGILQGVEEYCASSGYFVLFTKYDYAKDVKADDLSLPGVLRSHGVADCLILAGTNYDNFIEAVEKLGVPYVTLSNHHVTEKDQAPFDRVGWDDQSGPYEATRYLITLGHRDIWYIGDTALPWYRSRYAAYERAMLEADLEPKGQTVGLSDNYYANGYASAEFILDRGYSVTAVFAAYDEIAYGACDSFRKHGLDVPRDISIVGYGDNDESQFKAPPMTTVRIDKTLVGRHLAQMAIDKLQHPSDRFPEVVLPVQLVKRGTTRPLLPLTAQGA